MTGLICSFYFLQRQEDNIRKRDSLIGEYAAEYEFEGVFNCYLLKSEKFGQHTVMHPKDTDKMTKSDSSRFEHCLLSTCLSEYLGSLR